MTDYNETDYNTMKKALGEIENIIENIDKPKPTRGYYKVKFYNHKTVQVMLFNGKSFESFKSDTIINDEIEKYEPLRITYENI